jgi:hypothetical protein
MFNFSWHKLDEKHIRAPKLVFIDLALIYCAKSVFTGVTEAFASMLPQSMCKPCGGERFQFLF